MQQLVSDHSCWCDWGVELQTHLPSQDANNKSRLANRIFIMKTFYICYTIGPRPTDPSLFESPKKGNEETQFPTTIHDKKKNPCSIVASKLVYELQKIWCFLNSRLAMYYQYNRKINSPYVPQKQIIRKTSPDQWTWTR